MKCVQTVKLEFADIVNQGFFDFYIVWVLVPFWLFRTLNYFLMKVLCFYLSKI